MKPALTLLPHLLFDSIQATRLLNEIVDKFGCLFVCQLVFTDTSTRKQFFQIWVQIIGLE